jgi:hypothetical protein
VAYSRLETGPFVKVISLGVERFGGLCQPRPPLSKTTTHHSFPGASSIYFLTAVDVSLSMVILLLLGAITVRALLLVHERGDLRLLSRRTPK